MNLFIVENFLCCFELETGGLVMGWLGLITNVISIILLLVTIFLMGSLTCEDIIKFLHEQGHDQITIENCSVAKTAITVGIIITILIIIGFTAINILLIRGTQKRDHVLIRPSFIVVAVFGIFFVVTNLLTFTAQGFVSAVIYGLIYWYTFACLYSLFVKFRNEKQGTAQYMHP